MRGIRDLKIYKRFLALLSAGIMFISGLPAFAEENAEETTKTNLIATTQEDPQEIIPMEYDEFIDDSYELMDYIEPFSNKHFEIMDCVYEVYCLANYLDCKDIRNQLIEEGLISDNDYLDSIIRISQLYSVLMSTNFKKMEKSDDVEKMFDIGRFSRNEKTRELSRRALECFTKVYREGNIKSDSYKELLEILEELKERDYLITYFYYYSSMPYLYTECLLKGFTQKELKQYYSSAKKDNMDLKNMYELMERLEVEGPQNELEECIKLSLDNPYGSFGEFEEHYDEMLKEIKMLKITK